MSTSQIKVRKVHTIHEEVKPPSLHPHIHCLIPSVPFPRQAGGVGVRCPRGRLSRQSTVHRHGSISKYPRSSLQVLLFLATRRRCCWWCWSSPRCTSFAPVSTRTSPSCCSDLGSSCPTTGWRWWESSPFTPGCWRVCVTFVFFVSFIKVFF